MMMLSKWSQTNIKLTKGIEFNIYHTPEIDIRKMLQGWFDYLQSDDSITDENLIPSITEKSFCDYIIKNIKGNGFAYTAKQWKEVIPSMYN